MESSPGKHLPLIVSVSLDTEESWFALYRTDCRQHGWCLLGERFADANPEKREFPMVAVEFGMSGHKVMTMNKEFISIM